MFFKQTVGQLWDENGNELDAARHPLQKVKMKVDHPVRYFDMMRKNNTKQSKSAVKTAVTV